MSRELLSAAVDNAATTAEWDQLLAAVGTEPELMAEWSRIWQGRDAQTGVVLASGGKDFCASVMAALGEPEALGANVVPLASRRPAATAKRSGGMSWRSLAPLSAAAGVAAAVLFFGRPLFMAEAPSTVARVSAPVATQVAAATPAPVAATTVAANDEEANLQSLDPASAQVLNSYMMEHSNALAERSMGGAISNARFAARTADYRPDGQ